MAICCQCFANHFYICYLFPEMINFIPIFPLGIVLYPGESLNLHIFEPRYKQLITECFAEKKMFGIPTVVNNQLNEMGTLAEIVEISSTYENGEMDIKTKGVKVFSDTGSDQNRCLTNYTAVPL